MAAAVTVLSVDVGKNNLALCCVEAGADTDGSADRIRRWAVLSTQPTCAALVQTLRDAGVLDWLPTVSHVVIERQPGKNTPMVRLQCYLEMFFTMQGKPVTLADSRNKLSYAATTRFWTGGIPSNWTYYTRKKLAVQCTRAFLEATPQDPAVAQTFHRSRKQDDLADSLWQGMAYARTLQVAQARQ